MTAFRILLVVMIAAVGAYSAVTIANEGLNYISTAQRDLAAMGWAGQFDADFLMMLALSGLWVAWRHGFSVAGLGLGVLAFLGGVMFLAPYLLVLSFAHRGNVAAMLAGPARTRPSHLGGDGP